MAIVHIVTPTYNRHEELKRLLGQLEQQAYPDFIVHVCSDGPDEEVKAIVQEYHKVEYTCLEKHEGNVGSIPRIQVLNSLPDHDLVCFIDDDNTISQDFLLKLAQPFLDNPNLVMSACQIDHNLVGVIPQNDEIEFGQIDSLNVMVRSEVAKKHANLWLQKGPTVNHDFLFIEACSKEGPRVFIPEVLGTHNGEKKIRVTTFCKNEAALLPYFVRHYQTFADEIWVYDGNSSDGSAEIAESLGAKVLSLPGDGEELDDFKLLDMRNNLYKAGRERYSWQIVCDVDEFLYHPNILSLLKNYKEEGITVPKVQGYEMYALNFPTTSGQIYLEVTRGKRNPFFLDKTCIFDSMVDVNYSIGCHKSHPIGNVKFSPKADLKLLHFSHLGYEYTKKKAEFKIARFSQVNKTHNFGSHCYDLAATSKEVFQKEYEETENVMSANIHYRLQTQDPNSYKEIFLDNWYETKAEEIKGHSVLDLGANQGYWSIMAAEMGAYEVISVEANPEAYRILEENVKTFGGKRTYGGDQISCVFGAAISPGFKPVSTGRKDGYNPADLRCHVLSKDLPNPLDTYSLHDLMEMFYAQGNVIAKIDCEGGEYNLLYGASQEDLNRISCLYLETHEGAWNPVKYDKRLEHTKELITYLEYSGFEVKTRHDLENGDLSILKLYRKKGKKEMTENFNPEVSVVVYAQDYAWQLQYCLQSFLQQTYRPKEVVIVDQTENPQDLRQNPNFSGLFEQIGNLGINWSVVWGNIVLKDICHHDYVLEMKRTHALDSSLLSSLVDGVLRTCTPLEGVRFFNLKSEVSFRESLQAQDPWVYQEIFLDNLYQAKREEIEGKRVVDVGGNRGFFTVLASEFNAASSLVVEANRESFLALQNNTSSMQNVTCLWGAVLSHNFQSPKINSDPAFVPMDGKCYVTTAVDELPGISGYNENGTIPTYSLKDLVNMLPNDSKDCILKLDCEGSEFPIVYSTDQDTLNRFSYLYIEIHEGSLNPIEYCPKMENTQTLLNYLEYMGFKVVTDLAILPEVHVYKLFNDRSKKTIRRKGA
jgi:FkbM family methyltransferase